MATPVGFTRDDYFYKNVNVSYENKPVNFDPTYCQLSSDQLKNKFRDELNAKTKITEKSQPNLRIKGEDVDIADYPNIQPVQVDEVRKTEIINKTAEYYQSVCKNKDLAEELNSSLVKNDDGDQKYDDMVTYYNMEYLNKINLGVGIIFTCGAIFYTIRTSSQIPTV